MSNKDDIVDSLSTAKARVVRAFYDAAERVIAEHDTRKSCGESVSQALQGLNEVIASSKDLGSEEFANSLRAAAKEYCARIEEDQSDNG